MDDSSVDKTPLLTRATRVETVSNATRWVHALGQKCSAPTYEYCCPASFIPQPSLSSRASHPTIRSNGSSFLSATNILEWLCTCCNRHRCPTMALSRELIYDHSSRYARLPHDKGPRLYEYGRTHVHLPPPSFARPGARVFSRALAV